jgi:membrane protein required for beta-lactamase induction
LIGVFSLLQELDSVLYGLIDVAVCLNIAVGLLCVILGSVTYIWRPLLDTRKINYKEELIKRRVSSAVINGEERLR